MRRLKKNQYFFHFAKDFKRFAPFCQCWKNDKVAPVQQNKTHFELLLYEI